ncbi:MAG: antibiotic biosynthesis monooxygenase, partial [Alphaproteobacteria bacterium]|nr:antibiotic biosynthesis monooxygenase [Alphaproteobacteria bacterium]
MPEFSIRAEHRIKPECREAWIALARRHSANSLKDPACLRFDVLFSRDDPNLAMLYEV